MVAVTEKPPKTPFSSFMKFPLFFFDCVGLVPYGRPHIGKEIFFWISYGMLAICLVLEFIFFFKAIGNFGNFLDITALAPCMGFVALALAKMATIRINRSTLNDLMRELQGIYPTTIDEQIKYRIKELMVNTNFWMKCFTILMMILIWIFNLWVVFDSMYIYWDTQIWVKQLPYFMWFPYDVFAPYVYEPHFLFQIWAGFVTISAFISVDLFFCSVVSLLCLHFDILRLKLEDLGVGMKLENRILCDYIKRHQLLIRLSTELENIYSPSLLFNFMCSSILVCLAGFQVTAPGVKVIVIFKSALLLISALIQIFLLCWFGTRIIDQVQKSFLVLFIYYNII